MSEEQSQGVSPPQPDKSAPEPAKEAVSVAKAEEAPPVSATPLLALVVDDEPANRDFLMRLLEQAQLEVMGASGGQEALAMASTYENIALLVIDHKLPDMDGVDLIAKLRERYPKACVIMATMLDERALMEQAFANGCNVFLVKPHGFMELFRRLQEFGPDPEHLNHLVIDQHGFRPFRG